MARILIVDDDELVRMTLRQILESGEHTVAEAENGNIALSVLDDFNADLVVTDLLMPEKEGFETIGELRRRWPEIRIIAMSGGGRLNGNDLLSIAKKLGAHEVLPKPFRAEQVREMVSNVLA